MQVQVNDVGFGYSPYPHELSRDPRISLQAKGLFAVYGSFTSVTDPTAWPSEDYLCRLCGGLNAKTFRKYKRELTEAGWLSQVQRRGEHGRHGTLLVTRYASPALNPHYKPVSTDDQKTDVRQTADRKLVPQEQEPRTPTKNHSQQKACVPSLCVRKTAPSEDLPTEVKEAIEWTIQEQKRQGSLKNEVGMRCHLVKKALSGEFDTSAYLAHKKRSEAVKKASEGLISQVDEWKASAELDRADRAFWEEQRRKNPALFAGRA